MRYQDNYGPLTGEWNDSIAAELLWSSVNTREAVPDVMSPSTWSLWQIYYVEANPVKLPAGYPLCGNICGRPYLNLSLFVSMYKAIGKDIRKEMHGELIGSVQSDLDIPIIPFSALALLWRVLPGMIKAQRYAARQRQRFSELVSATPAWCRATRRELENIHTREALLRLWHESIKPRFSEACRLLRSVTMESSDVSNQLHLDLARVVGEADANTLTSNVSAHSDSLESLAPLLALSEVARGTISRESYLERYGHRGPHELELFSPGSEEEPACLDRQLADLAECYVAVEDSLENRRLEVENVRARCRAAYPREMARLEPRISLAAEAARDREAVRSEVTRITRLVRQFLLRAGRVTGSGEDIFFLSLEEMVALLSDDTAFLAYVPARRQAYSRYCALPPYPSLIIGAFDPFQWAADPHRRSDVFDSRRPGMAAPSLIKGFPGAAGCVEGIVRRIDCVEDGQQVQSGEILVTVTTNVGWTPLFPRLAAIVTDVGAPLSHAAIVAREMGIPAVVGCGNATMLLKTGDRVRVDGKRGVVEVLS
ncbi:MAG: PEP-utilizing enzyme [Bacteroidota bacterium]